MARPSRLLLQLGIALNAIAIGAWVVSRTAGLPYGAHSGVAEDAGFVDVTCVVLEGALLVDCDRVVLGDPPIEFGTTVSFADLQQVIEPIELEQPDSFHRGADVAVADILDAA